MSNSESSFAPNLLKRILGFSMGTWINAAVSFLLTPVITRIIPRGDLGRVDLFITFCGLLTYASTLGMHQSYMRYFGSPPAGFTKDSLFAFSIHITMIGGLLCGIVVFIGYPYFSRSVLGEETLFIPLMMLLYIISFGFLDVVKTKPRMEGNIWGYTIISVLSGLLARLSYLTYFFTRNVPITILFIVLLYTILALIYFAINRHSILISTMQISRASKIELFQYALPMVAVMFISNTNASIPKFFMNEYLTKEDIGLYTGALSLVSIITLVQSGVNVFWAPYVYANFQKKQREIQSVHLIITFGMVFCALGLLLFQDIIYLLLGKSYRDSRVFYSFMLASPVFYTIGETVGIGINIHKKTYLNIVIVAATLFSNICFSYFLVPALGNIGAAISVFASAAVMLFFKAVIGEHFYRTVHSPFKSWGAPALYAVAAVVSSVFTNSLGLRSAFIILIMLSLVAVYHEEVHATYKLVKQMMKR